MTLGQEPDIFKFFRLLRQTVTRQKLLVLLQLPLHQK